ncbi:integral membrane family protein [Neofusicoccum parvum]|nr:integral membrane family protein [Neofusicoccum parvum]
MTSPPSSSSSSSSSSSYHYELDETQKILRAVVITSMTITSAFILLRCFIRARLQSQFSTDDLFLILALAAFGVQTSFGLYAMDHGGFGRRTSQVPRDMYPTGLYWMVLCQCTYTLALLLAKLSIAFLQLRVMGLSTSTLRRLHHLSIGANVFFGLYEFFTLLFQCYPDPDGVFQPVIIGAANCTNRTPVLVSVYIYSAANILLDWYYSLAMVPLIWSLQNMKPVVKVSAILILGMGFFASIATLIRLKYLVGFANSRDPLLAIVPIALWSWIEECLGMCAACIATFRPLLRLIPGLRSSRGGSGSGACGLSGGPGTPGGGGVFVTWKSRLGGRGRRGGEEGWGLEDLEGGEEEDGEGRVSRRSGAVVEFGGEAVATRTVDAESVVTSKDGAEVRTVVDDAESQKSILQRGRAASLGPSRHSWQT